MKVIADLQIHSKYSRAVSPKMVLPEIARWAHLKGIDLVATGDWTHPLWFREIQTNLVELGNGLLQLKDDFKIKNQNAKIKNTEQNLKINNETKFLLATEVSCIYSQGGKVRRNHILIWSPSIATCEKIIKSLKDRGCNLGADGRPILGGFTSKTLCDLVLSIDEGCLVIPAHAWTPHFSVFGSESGFDSLSECFGEFSKYIYAIETGLSSDPAMNWRIKELDDRAILSFSDAHSGPKLGREATVFELEEVSYENIRKAIIQLSVFSHQFSDKSQSVISESVTDKLRTDKPDSDNRKQRTDNRIDCTLEFYPEEGKYHFTGHSKCQVRHSPEETKKLGVVCPVCGRKLTVGVMQRVEDLAERSVKDLEIYKKGMWVYSKAFPTRPPYAMLVPLQEIIAEVTKKAVTAEAVQNIYLKLAEKFGEFNVLIKTDPTDIAKAGGENIAVGIQRVREGDLVIEPGYDGQFGVISLDTKDVNAQKDQLSLFS